MEGKHGSAPRPPGGGAGGILVGVVDVFLDSLCFEGGFLGGLVVATNIYDQIENNIKTGKNELFNAIPVNAKAAADITYTDAEDNTEKTTSRQAVQFSLDKSAVAGFEQAE